jgi:hypothetical protein
VIDRPCTYDAVQATARLAKREHGQSLKMPSSNNMAYLICPSELTVLVVPMGMLGVGILRSYGRTS